MSEYIMKKEYFEDCDDKQHDWNVHIIRFGEKFNPLYGMDRVVLTKKDIEMLKNGAVAVIDIGDEYTLAMMFEQDDPATGD